jgi:phosphomannomutase
MMHLKIGISGVRGIVGETFSPELVVAFAQAFGTYADSGRILICRDTRPSGPMVRAAVCAGLLASGCEVIDLGICPTPSLQLATRWLGAQGGISITAGHNPTHWNALKFVRADGLYLTDNQAEELLDIYHQGEFSKAGWQEVPAKIQSAQALDHHIEILTQAFNIPSIRARKLRVAVDCCNGACSLLSPRWLESLGCQVLSVNDDISAPFPHSPEPNPQTMAQLRAVVKAGGADAGFAHDADGERLGLVTDTAEPLSEEMTLALATAVRLRQKKGPVVTNISTSMSIDAIARRHGVPVIRTPVGQAYISEAVIEHQAVIGGEGSGGVVVPYVQPTHDSFAAIGLILESLAATGGSLMQLVSEIPRFAMVKYNMPIAPNRIFSLLQRWHEDISAEPGARLDLTDGLKLSWDDGWIHVRASNTEPMIRIIVEAENRDRANELLSWARDRLASAGQAAGAL